MTRTEWLAKKHRELDNTITTLEDQKDALWSDKHRAMLQDLKKQKLVIKTELEIELATQNVSK
ncbi:DUF465 domain-containing protein [bacterium]|nr:DUF465 domain-containing protein [bacterium]